MHFAIIDDATWRDNIRDHIRDFLIKLFNMFFRRFETLHNFLYTTFFTQLSLHNTIFQEIWTFLYTTFFTQLSWHNFFTQISLHSLLYTTVFTRLSLHNFLYTSPFIKVLWSTFLVDWGIAKYNLFSVTPASACDKFHKSRANPG